MFFFAGQLLPTPDHALAQAKKRAGLRRPEAFGD